MRAADFVAPAVRGGGPLPARWPYPVDTNPLTPAYAVGPVPPGYTHPGTHPLGQTAPSVPFYKQPLVTFVAGALVIGATWFYFGFARPRWFTKKGKGRS